MVHQKRHEVIRWVREHKRRLLLWGGGGITGAFLLIQLFYPGNLLLPFTNIDGQSFSARDRDDVKQTLTSSYAKQTIGLYFGSAKQPYRTPSLKEIGLTVETDKQVDKADYPLWLRIVPTSILWGHLVRPVPDPTYRHDDAELQEYMKKELGQSCDVAPKNATLQVKKQLLHVVSAEKGGTCKLDDVKHRLEEVEPKLSTKTRVVVPMKERSPAVSDEQAKKTKTQLEARLKNGVTIMVGDQKQTIPREQIIEWIEFGVPEASIVVTVNAERSNKYVSEQVAPKVTKAPGVSKVATVDFTETSRVDGAPGQAIDTPATLASLGAYLTNGGDAPSVAVKQVAPRVEYARTYSPSDAGLSALMKHYAESHPGTYGVSLVELAGQKRRAVFQDTKQFRTASTYKLYVAYGTLKRVESGAWRWSDQIQGGRNLEKCFDDMIVKSDNPCGEVLLEKIGYRTLTDELKAVGLTGTSFIGKEPVTTAGDLTTFNAALESGQLVSGESKNRLISAMKRNVYRQGIPGGANGTVANKVGFLEGYLHDAAIIYGPTGPVVLSVMSNGSSWASIADLTRQIEALRNR